MADEQVTRRTYLLAMMSDAPEAQGVPLGLLLEAISTTALAHPEWDMDEIKTWQQWDEGGA